MKVRTEDEGQSFKKQVRFFNSEDRQKLCRKKYPCGNFFWDNSDLLKKILTVAVRTVVVCSFDPFLSITLHAASKARTSKWSFPQRRSIFIVLDR